MQQNNPAAKQQFLVIVTGLSGAGRSTAIKCLEDHDLFCIDNLPIRLIWQTVDFFKSSDIKCRGFALGMDNRDRRFATEFPFIKSRLHQLVELDVIYLTADSQVIAERYSATRRKHPLSQGSESLAGAIAKEASLLEPIKAQSDLVIDTTDLNPHQLYEVLEQRYAGKIPERLLSVTLHSFGYKHGYPRTMDMIFDVRFLKNPNFDAKLKDNTGLDQKVQDFVISDESATEFLNKLEAWMRFLLPRYYKEGKHYLRIGIGCTGGKHRSVTVTEWLGRRLKEEPIQHTAINVVHRDI